jgi:hypothetical protein
MKNLIIILLILITLITKRQTTTLRSFTEQKLVNSEGTTGTQQHCTIYKLSNSGFVVVWQDGPSLTHRMQIFNEVGDKIGTNISIIANCSAYKNFIADLGNNKFAFACVDNTTSKLIIYDYNGNVLSGPIIVTTTAAAHVSNINMMKIDNGNLVFVWLSTSYGIYYSVVSVTGNLIVNATLPASGNFRSGLVLESFSNNRFIICYKQSASATPNYADNVYCMVKDSLGVTSIPLITVENYTSSIYSNYRKNCTLFGYRTGENEI